MTTQLINLTTDFSATVLTDVTELQFTNPAGLATATFADTQFGTQIASDVLITGNASRNRIDVTLSTTVFDASTWQFAFWTATDAVRLTGSTLAEAITGSAKNDIITGNAGADTIRGHLGTDLADGGAGDDTFLFAGGEAMGAETILGGDDTDTLVLFGAGSHDLSAATISGVEALTFLGTAGGILNGGQIGAPGTILTVNGGTGRQSLTIADTGINLMNVFFTRWSQTQDQITLIGSGPVTGSITNDLILDVGQAAMNVNGHLGNDIIRYSAGGASLIGDILNGSGGTDTLSFDPGFNGAVYDLDDLTLLSSVEVVTFSTTRAMTIVTSENRLFGVTTVTGGAASVLIVTLLADDDLVAPDHGITGLARLIVTGGTGNNQITGADSDDSLSGSDGFDTLTGGLGADTMDGGANDDLLSYEGSLAGVTVDLDAGTASGGDATGDVISDFEAVLGSALADSLRGDAGENTLRGGSGDDTLNGAGGTDQLRGGGGNDRFVFQAVNGSPAGAARDEIMDFTQGQDQIDLSQIDAIAGGADDAFVFRGTLGFGPQAGLRYEQKATKTLIHADIDGDQIADFSVTLHGVFTLTAADFIL